MPFINIKVAGNEATTEQKKRLISGVTQVVAETLGKDVNRVMVMIEELHPDNVGLAGVSVTDFLANKK